MRKLIIDLNQHFGIEHNSEITRFANDQFLTTGHCEGIEFTLRDVCEDKITRVVMELISEFNLSLRELVDGVLLVPCMSSSQSEFDVVTEFRPVFFQKLLGQSFVTECGLVRGSDTFEYYGKDRHAVVSDVGGNRHGEINAGFINGTMLNGTEVCIFMDKEEMAALRSDYTAKKYHGSSLDEDAWNEILIASIYRRFATEPMTELVLASCGERAERLTKALMHGKDAFVQREFESDKIMSSYGKVIATKVINYKASEEKRLLNEARVNAAKRNRPTLQIVVDNTQSIEVDGASSYGEEVATEWGAF